jgi:hypothetical protein
VLDPGAVRALAVVCVLAVVATGACDFAHGTLEGAPDDDADGVAPECATAADCIVASTTCCGCGEYAMPDDGLADSCEDVPCDPDPSADCPPLIAACVDGVCTTACQAITCDLSCPAGFAIDGAGCLSCQCASGPPSDAECSIDADCAQVPADCCGCARGGADTAVPVDQVTSFGESLMCPADPGDAACPEVDVCDPALAAHCEAGRCVLSDAFDIDEVPPTCGRPDLPPCPTGTVCVLNADSEASMEGLGTCQPA